MTHGQVSQHTVNCLPTLTTKLDLSLKKIRQPHHTHIQGHTTADAENRAIHVQGHVSVTTVNQETLCTAVEIVHLTK